MVFDGFSPLGWDGFINHSRVPKTTARTNGSSQTSWSSKTGKEIQRDINDAITGIWTSTRQTAIADTILLPPTSYSRLTDPMGSDNPGSIGKYVMENNVLTQRTGRKLMMRELRQLENAGVGGTKRMVAYRRDTDVLVFHMPMPLKFFEVQRWLTRFIVPGKMRLGGLEIKLPGEIRYVDAI